MSASADKPKQTCGKCGTLFQLVGQFSDLCAACLLDLGWEEEEPTASAERFDHYQVATLTEARPWSWAEARWVSPIGPLTRSWEMRWLLRSSTLALRPSPKLGNVFCEKPARRLGFATRTLPQSFTTGHARVMVNAFTRWNWSRAKHWKR